MGIFDKLFQINTPQQNTGNGGNEIGWGNNQMMNTGGYSVTKPAYPGAMLNFGSGAPAPPLIEPGYSQYLQNQMSGPPMFNPALPTDKKPGWMSTLFGENGIVLPIAQTAGTLASAYTGWKNANIAEDTLNFQKKFANKQLANTVQDYTNKMLTLEKNNAFQQGIDQYRVSHNGLTPDEYVAKNTVKA